MLTKYVSALLAATMLTSAFAADVQFKRVKRADLPPSLPVKGTYETGVTWQDSNGENIVVFSKSASRNATAQSANLYAVGFKIDQGKPTQVWQVHDWIEDCQLDLPAFFESSSIEVTDLDANAIGEISFVYRIACLGGMDYIDEKLFLVENGKKFPIRGATQFESQNEATQKAIYDGPMKVDQAYNDAPKPFKRFAIAKWQRFKTPSFD